MSNMLRRRGGLLAVHVEFVSLPLNLLGLVSHYDDLPLPQ